MVVYDNRDFSAFEVEGALLGRRGLVRLVRSISGAVVLRSPKLFSRFRESEFCEFQVDGEQFVAAAEGWGGRYRISPRHQASRAALEQVREAFCLSRPFFGFMLRQGQRA